MSETIQDVVHGLPLTDVHEHHMPGTLLNREVGLLQLLEQSYAGWTRQRPYALPSETPAEPMLTRVGEGGWPEIAAYVEGSGSNAFVRNLVWALAELYELDQPAITEDNWRRLDAEIQRRHRDPEWVPSLLARARIEHVVTDPYANPLMDTRRALGERYSSVLRVNAFAFGWHPEALDHNGNSGHILAQRMGATIETFDDYMKMLDALVATLSSRHQVGLKIALAYDRGIRFDDVDEKRARSAWGKREPSEEEKKAFGDVVIDRLCRTAGAQGVPVQMHLGTAQIRGSHPMNAAGLIERYPNTRFLLMHLAYPWSADLLGLAFVYRNIWLDLTWAPLLSPSHFKRALHEAIEILPDESRMMIGGDNWHIEETYGTLKFARKLIGEVLAEKLHAGYFRPADARRLATKILYGNGRAFFGLS